MKILRNRSLVIIGIAESVSGIGNWVTMLAVFAIVVFRGDGTVAQSSGIFLAGLLPTFLASPLAGWLCDRFDRKWLMIGSELLDALAVAGLIFTQRLELIYALLAAQAVVMSVMAPARQAAVPDIVSPEELTRANAFLQQLGGLVKIAGPLLAGLILAALDPHTAILADVVSFLLSALILSRLPALTPRREEGWRPRSGMKPAKASTPGGVDTPGLRVMGVRPAEASSPGRVGITGIRGKVRNGLLSPLRGVVGIEGLRVMGVKPAEASGLEGAEGTSVRGSLRPPGAGKCSSASQVCGLAPRAEKCRCADNQRQWLGTKPDGALAVLRGSPGLQLLFLTMFLAILVIVGFDVLSSIVTRDVLQGDERLLGLLVGLVGIGTAAAALYLVLDKRQREPWHDLVAGLALMACLPGSAALAAVLGDPGPARLALAAGCLIGGIGDGLAVVQAGTLLQQLAPPAMLGRMGGLWQSSATAGQLAGIVVTPLLVPHLLSTASYFAITTAALGLLVLWMWRAVRHAAVRPIPAEG